MEANSKLQKKKRIAHSHMSKSNFDGPKLSPDDFVYNIMKDMDSKNIMSSYQLSKDPKSNRRQETFQKKGQNLKNSNRDSYCKKQERNILPKRSFPLMQKCQTSLKYLKKNCCIPKPRAHVGSMPKPPKQPAIVVEPSANSKTDKSNDCVKRTKIQSKAYSQVIESNLKRDSNIKIQLNNTIEKDLITQSNYSSSDDDDAAYENFLKISKEESKISSDSDSDSRLTICRKKGKSRQRKTKCKRQEISYDNNKYISKVTSIPLSDSSDSESEGAFEVNESLKNKKVSTRSHTQTPTNPSESSDSSLDELPDLNANSSSEEDYCVEAGAAKNTRCTTGFIGTSMPAMESSAKSSLRLISKDTHQQSDQNFPSTTIDSIILAHPPMIDKNLDDSNGLISFDSMTTVNVQKYQIPCCVRLKRDPLIEQKAQTYCLTKNCSADDCIIISDESDNEASTPLPSNVAPSFSPSTQHQVIENSDSRNFEDMNDCVIMCELPKVGSSSKLNPENMHSSTESISTDFRASHDKPTVGKDITLASTEINCNQSSSSDENTSVPCENTSKTIKEFKVQIVAVKSLVEQSENSLIPKAGETKEIEIVDLSDDDLNFQNDGANISSEVVNQHGAEPCTKGIQHNVNVIPFMSNDQDQDSQTLLSNPIQQSPCEESLVQVQNFSNSKILEVLSKIDFDSIKEIINKTNSINLETSIVRETVTHEEQHKNKLSIDRPLPDSINNNFSKTEAAIQGNSSVITPACVSNNPTMELTSKLNASKHITFVNAGETTCTAKLNVELSNKIHVGENNTSAILNSEGNPLEISGTGNQIVTVCGNLQQPSEEPLIPVAIGSQLNSVKEIKVIEPKTTIGNRENEYLPRSINDKKRKKNANYGSVIKKPKCEIFENPSDELDVIAASFTKDLSTPNKKVDALLNLYEAEYAKYMNIISTEANVTLGLKMLHNKQLEKLTHLRSSIKNLVKHDPCYHTVIQEKLVSEAQACIKNEGKLKENILIPTKSEKSGISVNAITDIETNASSAKESGSAVPTHPELEEKLVSSEDRQEAETVVQSEVREKPSAVTTAREKPSATTTAREKFLKYMKNIKCAECGKRATARCQGCAQVFYCSSQCGVLSWKKGHNIVCRRRT